MIDYFSPRVVKEIKQAADIVRQYCRNNLIEKHNSFLIEINRHINYLYNKCDYKLLPPSQRFASIDERPGETYTSGNIIDISHLDFDLIKKLYEKSPHKNTTVASLKEQVEQCLQ